MATTNIAGYRFARLTKLQPLRDELHTLCRNRHLKGTILLSTEGVNLFVAGSQDAIATLLAELRRVPGLEEFEPKFSVSDDQPFTRMLVKIKKEIIAFGVPTVDPVARPSPKISATQLKQWLDEGRPLTLLDTRNNFEIDLGTFDNALPVGISHFREFPEAVRSLPEKLKQQPIVMFCTGGIRCEKAGPFMQQEGFEQIFQLDGGILKYFEEVGNAHYHGDCFVFDKRVALDADLSASGKAQCYVCQSPLTEPEQADPRYREGVSCLYCFKTEAEQALADLESKRKAIHDKTHPLPGDEPYKNYRPLKIPGSFAGRTLLDFLNEILGHRSEAEWADDCERGLLLDAQFRPVPAGQRLKDGERYFHEQAVAREPTVNADIQILHQDTAIIVVNKPAPLPVHPCGRFNKNSLTSILNLVYAPQKPRPSHRLDANTTGVMVFARTSTFARQIQPQFERGEVEKDYLARVHGHPTADEFDCTAPIADDSGVVGSRAIDEMHGLPAHTQFRVLQRDSNGTALLAVRPRTGRTNQIRVHLWHLGLPIVGDMLYLTQHKLGSIQTIGPEDPPLNLHAHRVTLTHPISREPVTFEGPPPAWAEQISPSVRGFLSREKHGE